MGPIVRGNIYTVGLFFNLKLRYFVLNPAEGTFIRYKSKEDYPMKPLEVIPTKDIRWC